MKTRKTTWIVFFYAIMIFAGGLMGYFVSGSKASLISGGTFGLLLFGAFGLMFFKKPAGSWIALILSIMLEGVFTWRFAKTLHFIPSGLLSLLTLAVIILLALKIASRFKRGR